MANASSLINFGGGGSLAVGDWTYSASPLSAPTYLPLTSDTASYLSASYPTLAAAINTPVTAFSTTTGANSYSPNYMAYGNGVIVLIPTSSNTVIAVSSDNGATWTTRQVAANINFYGIVFGNGVFAIAANNGTASYVYSSPDGITWTSKLINAASSYVTGIAYGNGIFFAGGSISLLAVSYDNCQTFNEVNISNSVNYNISVYGNGTLVSAKSGVASATAIQYSNAPLYSSFSLASTPTMAVKSLAFGNGVFVALYTASTSDVVTSPNGITWTNQSAVLPASAAWTSVTFGNGAFLAVASTGTVCATSTDGVTWVSRTLPAALGSPTVVFTGRQFVASGSTAAYAISYAVAQTTFKLPVVPAMKGSLPYIKAS